MENTLWRIFIEKKDAFDVKSRMLLSDFRDNLGIKGLESLKIVKRYDVEGISREVYEKARSTIFSDPVVDDVYDEEFKVDDSDIVFAVEYLPGQYDQRADFASQCLQILTKSNRPKVRTADVIILRGNITYEDVEKIKSYYINPVEMREADLDKPKSLETKVKISDTIEVLEGFIEAESVEGFGDRLGLAMSPEDLVFCRDYFKNVEKRNPTITEIRVIDTYWSDHCRHTTFNTIIENVSIEDGKYKSVIEKAFQLYMQGRTFVYGEKPKEMCLMDMAQMTMREMRKKGELEDLEVSEEINACSIEVEAEVDGKKEKWLVMFKNETHNHPTEIEPFGGAATCLGGAIRDPLSGRAYVYGAMRITGSGDPRKSISETLSGKLPQRKITTKAAEGYSSYGNQIGVAAGQVAEIYHEDFIAKRMELGAVIAAAPKYNVVRKSPVPGDVVILLGGKTGRDGCGGATGSSKEHDEESLVKSGAEVQKGNAPIERRIQRLFRKHSVSKMIKKCNDFGAGGVSVAIGELSDSLLIDLDAVPVKYEGLDGTELAISESQERMAVVVSADDKEKFIRLAEEENIEAVEVAKVTDSGRLKMLWKGMTIVDISRDFLDTNGIRQKTKVYVNAPSEKDIFFESLQKGFDDKNIKEIWMKNLKDLNVCSQKGLVEKFDSSAGSCTVLSPFGGKYQDTPAEGLLMKLPVLSGNTDTAVAMAYGYNPYLSKWSPFHGGLYAVLHAVCRIVALGGDYKKIRLTMQEYFEKLGTDESRWGKPFAALLGAYKAQKGFNIPAIGGKDSMSGTFMDLDVPPTLVAFAVAPMDVRHAMSQEFKSLGSKVVMIPVKKDENHIPDFEYLKKVYDKIHNLIKSGLVLSASTIKEGGAAAAITKMCFGNRIGIKINGNYDIEKLFDPYFGSLILELGRDFDIAEGLSGLDYILLGETWNKEIIGIKDVEIDLKDAYEAWNEPLEEIFPTKADSVENIFAVEYKKRNTIRPSVKIAKPRVLIPVFPGTNGEYDIYRAFEEAGAEIDILIMKNLTPEYINESIKELAKCIGKSQIIAMSGSFSSGDAPYGSTRFMTAIFREEKVKEALYNFLSSEDGLMLGIGNGFQALLNIGLLPYGEIRDIDENRPSLTTNKIGRHVSQLVRTKVTSILSPWFAYSQLGDIHIMPVSHGEGRFVAEDSLIEELAQKGQIAAQYVDVNGNVSGDIPYNPNGSANAIESLISPDGRILGKMGHSERVGQYVSINVPGNKEQSIFKAGVDYFRR